jgi:hypothetical protein
MVPTISIENLFGIFAAGIVIGAVIVIGLIVWYDKRKQG